MASMSGCGMARIGIAVMGTNGCFPGNILPVAGTCFQKKGYYEQEQKMNPKHERKYLAVFGFISERQKKRLLANSAAFGACQGTLTSTFCSYAGQSWLLQDVNIAATNRANKTTTANFFMVQSLELTPFKIRKNLQIIKITHERVFDSDARHKPDREAR